VFLSAPYWYRDFRGQKQSGISDYYSIPDFCSVVKENFRGDFFGGDFGFSFADSGDVFSMTIEGEMVFVLAYSGIVGTMLLEGGFSFYFAYSGLVFSMTIEGVSFRTGLRG